MKKKKTKKRRRVILLIAEIILILLLTLLLFAVVKLSKIQKTKLDMDQVAINEDLSSETMDAMSDYRSCSLRSGQPYKQFPVQRAERCHYARQYQQQNARGPTGLHLPGYLSGHRQRSL